MTTKKKKVQPTTKTKKVGPTTTKPATGKTQKPKASSPPQDPNPGTTPPLPIDPPADAPMVDAREQTFSDEDTEFTSRLQVLISILSQSDSKLLSLFVCHWAEFLVNRFIGVTSVDAYIAGCNSVIARLQRTSDPRATDDLVALLGEKVTRLLVALPEAMTSHMASETETQLDLLLNDFSARSRFNSSEARGLLLTSISTFDVAKPRDLNRLEESVTIDDESKS